MIGWKPKSGNQQVASVRYRCLMPLEAIWKFHPQVDVELYRDSKQREYKLVLFSKLYDNQTIELARRIKEMGAKVALDICDNHFYNPHNLDTYNKNERDLRRMIGISDYVVCSTPTLAGMISNKYGVPLDPFVVGDPIDLSCTITKSSFLEYFHLDSLTKQFALSPRSEKQVPEIIWFGSHGSPNAPNGMFDLLQITRVLESVYKKKPFVLHVVSDNFAKFKHCEANMSIPMKYSQWNMHTFDSFLAKARATIIPITLNEFSICKTNNRLALSLSRGVPVVADSIPSYEEFKEFCYLDLWEEGLLKVLEDAPEVNKKVSLGRKYVQEAWSPRSIASQWIKVFECMLTE